MTLTCYLFVGVSLVLNCIPRFLIMQKCCMCLGFAKPIPFSSQEKEKSRLSCVSAGRPDEEMGLGREQWCAAFILGMDDYICSGDLMQFRSCLRVSELIRFRQCTQLAYPVRRQHQPQPVVLLPGSPIVTIW